MDPAHIRRQPYVPTANFIPVLRAAEAGININPRGLLSCVPGVSSYVGGDTTAGILSSGIYQKEEPCILIDIGTNGEIVLGNRDFLVACAAAAALLLASVLTASASFLISSAGQDSGSSIPADITGNSGNTA